MLAWDLPRAEWPEAIGCKMQASLVLLNWKRPDNIPAIIANRPDWCSEVVVWNNSPQPLSIDGARVIESPCGNVSVLGRFVAANLATCDVVITQDDDCVVPNWDELRARFEVSGRITCNLTPSHFRMAHKQYLIRDANNVVAAYESLLGFGSIWNRNCIRHLVSFAIKCPDHWALVRRKADRLFCMSQLDHIDWISVDVKHMPGAIGRDALYRQKDHWATNEQARELFRRVQFGVTA